MKTDSPSTMNSFGEDSFVDISPEEQPIRVCYIVDALGVAGIEGQIQLLLQHLDRAKVKPYLCLLRGGQDSGDIKGLPHCTILRLGVGSLHSPSVLRKAVAFWRFLRNERIEVIHPLFPDSLYFGAPVAKLAGVPCIVRFRVDLGYWMKGIDRWLSRLLNCVIDATMTNCEACKQIAVEQEWATPGSVTVIPNGVDLSRFQKCAARVYSERSTTEKRIGIVANLRPVKNIDLFVRAAKAVKAQFPKTRFLIAGEGESRAELERLVQTLELRDDLEFLGVVADIPAFLNTLDVAVLCSRSEGSPNALMEYMAAGRAIVTTNVGGCGELIEHEDNGLLVASDDVEQLSAAIMRLLNDRDLADRLADNATQQAFSEYGVELQAHRYESFYRALLLKKRVHSSFPVAGRLRRYFTSQAGDAVSS